LHEFDQEQYPDGRKEPDRFFQSLDYHRSLLFDYRRRWQEDSDDVAAEVQWPRHIPEADLIRGLEIDWLFCQASPNYRGNRQTCQDQQFRIASYYLLNQNDPAEKRKGAKLVKDLAEHGHPDGMCLYAMILMDGRVPGVDANPEEAVIWFRRCVDLHRHIAATYELAVAHYTGEGLAENPEYALKLFRQAAHLGHAGAAYMLGECLLDGVGCERDRAEALEWLITAAELGHHLARERVLTVLQEDHADEGDNFDDEEWTEADERRVVEAIKWADERNDEAAKLERRHTVGCGGSQSPKVTARRKSKVEDSRGG